MQLILFFATLIIISQCSQFPSNFRESLMEAVESPQSMLGEKCHQQLRAFATNLALDPNSWALQMLDASSKLPSGALALNVGEMGNFDQCVNIAVSDYIVGRIYGKYCLGFMTFPHADNNVSTLLNSIENLDEVLRTSWIYSPTWSICLPDGCSSSDFNFIANSLLGSFLNDSVSVKFGDLFCQTINDVDEKLTVEAAVTIVILLLIVFIIMISTIYDLYCFSCEREPLHIILVAFSVYSNGKKVFKMSETISDQFQCLNGLRFISMIWIVAGHQYTIMTRSPLTNTNAIFQFIDSLPSQFLFNGNFAVDTFLVITGALMVYGFMKSKQKNVKFNLFQYYLHRYIRLTAPLLLVVLVSATLLGYLGSGPQWNLIRLYFQRNCQENWWSTILYVQNYVNIDKMCVGQTWYLCVDMQLYLISPLIFYILWKKPPFGLLLLTMSIFGFTAASFHAAWVNNLTALLSNIYGPTTDNSNKYYLLTHTRGAPWVIGVILGHFMFKIKTNQLKFRPNKYVVLILWIVCLSTLLTCILGGHNTLRGNEYDQWGNSLHIALARPAWALAISWIILACVTSYGGPINWILSLPIYQVLNKFTYSLYLTHVTLLYAILYSKKTPEYFSSFNTAYNFWGTLWISSGLAVLLVFMAEAPAAAIENAILGKFTTTKKRTRNEIGVVNLAFKESNT